ncbi:MAG: thiamine-phosphate kinase [Methanomicrobiales archaeon]|nr:thiamine-phosphate kinase [Methanomicrobiales archaeon]
MVNERVLLTSLANLIGKETIADDCAILPLDGTLIVATTDMLHETTDFPAGMTDWQRGWMAVAATLSDIAAMGACPLIVLIAVGLDRPERLRPVMEGAVACCSAHGATLGGGDIDSHKELTLVTTGIGIVNADQVVRRKGSQDGDAICVTGILGGAQAALLGHHQYEPSLFEPHPRIAEGRTISCAGATSMMDISDGLALSLHDLAAVNEVGYAIYSDELPLIPELPPEEARELALFGGGDYELLFTISPDALPLPGLDEYRIGEVIREHRVLLDGKPLPSRGYQHRWRE